jgi:hypothetical protein
LNSLKQATALSLSHSLCFSLSHSTKTEATKKKKKKEKEKERWGCGPPKKQKTTSRTRKQQQGGVSCACALARMEGPKETPAAQEEQIVETAGRWNLLPLDDVCEDSPVFRERVRQAELVSRAPSRFPSCWSLTPVPSFSKLEI